VRLTNLATLSEVRSLSQFSSRKVRYLLRCLANSCIHARKTCPNCGASHSSTVSRKHIISTLRRCHDCFLLFRTPTTDSTENARYYQSDYEQGTTTDLPNDDQLSLLMATRFAGTDLDRSDSIEIIRSLGGRDSTKLFDYGCSWGYGAWQFQQAGFDVQAYEISKPRSQFAARKLGIRIEEPSQVDGESFDFVYSSHVIEHVPCPRSMLREGLRMLRTGGLFVAITPNGSMQYRQTDRRAWQQSWGEVHPQLICEKWIRMAADSLPYFVSTVPVNLKSLSCWGSEQVVVGGLDQPHLFFAIRKG